MIEPGQVMELLTRNLLMDGYDLVLDTDASTPSRVVDARTRTEYVDMYTFFASSPLGMNPPQLINDPQFLSHIGRIAVNKPSNSDVYTIEMAHFVDTFDRVLGIPGLDHYFFIDGGALAVENALKAAFDWKHSHNANNNRDPKLGNQVMHLRHAFHGRSGYTLSLTNTERVKVDGFPKFDWPRISSPAISFPLTDLAALEAAEAQALAEAEAAFEANQHDIACFLFEPIQSEGGDRHLRAEFLQAMQALCVANDALFIVDEVQTGVGITGTAWAHQQLGLEPDMVAFGKKTQVCGVMAGRRVDDVEDNVFRVSSRINSTWGGNLTDMVRSARILEVIESENLFEHAAKTGAHLLSRLDELAAAHPSLTNVRGRGLLCAIDLPSTEMRDAARRMLFEEERVMILSAGPSTLRFRPHLATKTVDIDLAIDSMSRVIDKLKV